MTKPMFVVTENYKSNTESPLHETVGIFGTEQEAIEAMIEQYEGEDFSEDFKREQGPLGATVFTSKHNPDGHEFWMFCAGR